jgi:hypothetical protein
VFAPVDHFDHRVRGEVENLPVRVGVIDSRSEVSPTPSPSPITTNNPQLAEEMNALHRSSNYVPSSTRCCSAVGLSDRVNFNM